MMRNAFRKPLPLRAVLCLVVLVAYATPSSAPPKSSQQKLMELQSLYDQKLITQADYDAAKKKILGEMVQ